MIRPRDHESESPQRTWSLRRDYPDARDALGIVAPALDALFALAGDLFQPIEIRTEIGWLDLEHLWFHGYARPMEWCLGRRQPPPGRDWSWWPVPETLELVDRIDRAAADRLVARAADQVGPEGSIACPFLLAFYAVRTRLLEPVPDDQISLILGRKEGPASLAIERDGHGAWVYGPSDGFITPPVRMAAKLHDYVRLSVAAHWTPWSEEDRPGTRAVEEAVARVAATGWKVEE